ncbi:MAG: NAD(P)-dependent oxidoreductase [Gammaproteobacteria bacterium]|nr:NAD(P)-dependent oxidoreductase [Gammaproteobacteria bacterium]
MKVVVTGATGFVGRYVVTELEARGVESLAVSRQARKLPAGQGCGVSLDLHDVPVGVYELLGCPDVLIHLAWSGLPNYKSLHHFEVELPAHYAFLKALIDGGLKHLVVAGTCLEYGIRSGPLSEVAASHPTTAYGFAKDALRRQLEFLREARSFRLVWARLFYLYGEGQAESSLYSQLRRAAEKGNRVFNMSGGEQLRDFLPVGKAAAHLVSLALTPVDAGVVNVCSGKPISIRKLVEGWIDEHRWAIAPNLGYYPYPDYEAMAFWGDRSKLDRLLAR